MAQNRYNTTYILYPITQAEIEEKGLEALPKGARIGGLMFPPSEVERAYHRWLKSKDPASPYDSENVAGGVKALRLSQKEAKDQLNDQIKVVQSLSAEIEKIQAETQKWIQKNHQHCADKNKLNQRILEVEALQKESEQEKSVSDSLVTAREKEVEATVKECEELQRTIDRYQAKYGAEDRKLTYWQRFGAWLFGL